jgi:hypothetical protein
MSFREWKLCIIGNDVERDMLKTCLSGKKQMLFLKKRQKYVVEYKKKLAGVSNNVHLCSDNLNNLFALEPDTY